MIVGAIRQGGLIDTGKQDGFDIHAWGMDVLNGVSSVAPSVWELVRSLGGGQGFKAVGGSFRKPSVKGTQAGLGRPGFVNKHKGVFSKIGLGSGGKTTKELKAAANLAALIRSWPVKASLQPLRARYIFKLGRPVISQEPCTV